MKNWFGESFRKVHVLYVSPEWAPKRCEKFDAKEYIEILSEAGVDVIEFYIKDHHGISYNKTEIGNFCGKEMLEPLVKESHAAGLKFIAYYSIGWDKWAWENYPDWRVPDSEQKGIRNPVNPDSGYGEFALRQLEEIAKKHEIDGVFLDIFNGDRKFLQKIVNVVKKYRTEALITFNGAGGGREELNPLIDFSSIEGHGPNYQHQSCISKVMQRENKPFEVTTPGHTLGWAGWCPKPASMLILEAAVVSANGGSLTIGLNPYPDGSVSPLEIENLGKAWNWLKPREEYLVGAKCFADVAVLMPRYFDLAGLHAALVDHHIQFDVIKPDVDFKKYKMIILHDEVDLDESTKDKVKDYVKDGGKLIAMYDSCSGLEDILGIEVSGDIPYTTSYAGLKDESLTRHIIGMPVLIKGNAKMCKETTGESLASLIYPLAEYSDNTFFGWSPCNPPGEESSYPMIVHNSYGSGETLYIAAAFRGELDRTHGSGAPWLKQLLANMIDKLIVDRVIGTSVKPGVELVLNKQEDRYVVHLINTYSGMSGRYSLDEKDVLKITDVKLWLNEKRIGKVSRIYQVPDGNDVSWSKTDDYVEVEAPPFGIHSMLVIE